MTDIKVNETEWNSLSQDDQGKIKNIITGIFKEKHNLIPDSSAVESKNLQASPQNLTAEFANPFCTAACGVAEAAAVAACGALSGPAVGVCIIAAHAAADYCRSRC